jgi:SAM-dependent methyltransferase
MVYQTSNLKSISPEEFTQYIHSKIGEIDAQSEGYSDYELDRQRDLSIKFHWGHNHDFGDFKLEGRMGDRHITLLANFISLFPISLEDFKGKDVFDIGCWTGGTTLLLATLGCKVFAIEEVKKYAEMASFLVKSFGIESQVTVKPMSIYDCNSEEFYDRFDIVYFPGVIYHLSDPLLALRILFNSLRIGGIILIESAGINREEPLCRFDGSLIYRSGTRERLNRSGWNWFIPSPSALYRMMREAGFDEVETLWHDATNRIYGYGEKVSQVGICKAGLSVPSIR